jgi:hypothetical protein
MSLAGAQTDWNVKESCLNLYAVTMKERGITAGNWPITEWE